MAKKKKIAKATGKKVEKVGKPVKAVKGERAGKGAKKAPAKKTRAAPIERDIPAIKKLEKEEIKRLRRIEQLEKELHRDIKRIEKETMAGEKAIGRVEKAGEELKRLEEAELKKLDEAAEQTGEMSAELVRFEEETTIRSKLVRIAGAAAGAFIGFALGVLFFNMLSVQLKPLNLAAILLAILTVAFLLFWKREAAIVKKMGMLYIVKKVIGVFLLCIVVELVSFAIFNMLPNNPYDLLYMLIVTSYLTMAGAVAFSLS